MQPHLFVLLLLGIEQTMKVSHKITHLGVIDASLRFAPPSRHSRGVVRIKSDELDLIEVFEFGAAQILKFAAEYKMEKLFLRGSRFVHNIVPTVSWRQ